MKQLSIPQIRPGDEVTAKWAEAIRLAIMQNALIPGSSVGVEVTQTEAGTTISVRTLERYVGVVTEDVSARSGATPGKGTVELYAYSTPDDALRDTGQSVPVLNFASFAGGIPAGSYVWIQEDLDNNYWVISAECPA